MRKNILPAFAAALLLAPGAAIAAPMYNITEITEFGAPPPIDWYPTDYHATGINDSGQVVGVSTTANGYHGFIWNSGIMTDLGLLPSDLDDSRKSSRAYGINNSGQVVGAGNTTTGQSAFIWNSADGMLDLNDLLVDNAGWHVNIAKAINASGQIIGYGNSIGASHPSRRSFLLTPVDAGPPPLDAVAPDTLDLAKLALHVYPDSRQSDIGDFVSLGAPFEGESNLYLPFVEAYIRRGENGGRDQIVISIRGTEPLSHDWLLDLDLLGSQDGLLNDSLERIAGYIGGIREQNPHADFTFTGHSLGGAMATILAKESGVNAVTFNAPGTTNIISNSRRDEYGQLMGNLPSSTQDVTNYRHYGDFVSLLGFAEGSIITVRDDLREAILANAAIFCVPCHNMANLLYLLENDYPTSSGIFASVPSAIIHLPVSVGLDLSRKFFDIVAEGNLFNLLDPPLIGDVIEIDLGLSDVMINGILVGGLPGDEFPLFGLSDDVWFNIGTLFAYVPLDVDSYSKYRIYNASHMVDDFGNYIIGLRFDRDGTFRGSLGAPESTNSVPEPGALFLLGTGLLGLVRLRYVMARQVSTRRKWAA